MKLAVVPTAERHRELITDFETDCSRLGKPQVVGIAGLPAADQARLRCDKFQMRLVTQPFRFCEDELALVDPIWGRATERYRRKGRGIHVGLVLWKEFLDRAAMSPPVIVRRARDWRRIIRVQSRARLGMQIREHRL